MRTRELLYVIRAAIARIFRNAIEPGGLRRIGVPAPRARQS